MTKRLLNNDSVARKRHKPTTDYHQPQLSPRTADIMTRLQNQSLYEEARGLYEESQRCQDKGDAKRNTLLSKSIVLYYLRSIMSLKRKKTDETELVPDQSGMSDTQLSISSLLQQQRHQALDILTRLESQQKQLELSREKDMEDLKQECQRLRSENQKLHSQIDSSRPASANPTAPGAPLSGASVIQTGTAFGSLYCEFEQVAKHALEFDINGTTTREIGVLCQVLHTESCRNNLKRFMQAQTCVTTTHHHCLRKS
ncbi:hypothetical protein FPOAC1_008838 [Fusarium poae]|uniref:hypothetical protein n=1 Tax=Fusarium poae TaxID=36050 RepID=UPI001CE7E86E|nr:hypothetical protein FPOAC1_008838 [Fusarium poae]KAG8669443.1 hypothetical protein FPOAC1_008838 [Fusarium poae]